MNTSIPPPESHGRPRITRRAASVEDVPFLLKLRHQTMDQHLAASGITIDESEHLARVMHRFEASELLLVGSEPVGLLKLDREGQVWELIQLQLVPELQRQGLGAGLLREVIAEAEVAGAALSLCVLKENPARSLYERLGFVVEGEDGHEYVMCRPARPSPGPDQ